MTYDIFLSICQTVVDGYKPSERQMFENFFRQVRLADELDFETAWVAETHLSCQTQKQTSNPVIPEFEGEIGLNTDILQMAHRIFSTTQNIHVGSAIRNILCNGGPIAHAEAIRTFLMLHGLDPTETRRLNIGFASGRFEFSNRPYGIQPRSELEQVAWPVMKTKILQQATEAFLRLLKGEQISGEDLRPIVFKKEDFRDLEMWQKAQALSGQDGNEISVPNFYDFEKVGVIPFEAPLDLLDLTIGTHDPMSQRLANEILPVGVFNLSITPPKVIEETHERMARDFHPDGGAWSRWRMPRTAMVFMENKVQDPNLQSEKAKHKARSAWGNYWKAMQGTIDNEKVEKAVNNALVGTPDQIAAQIREKYHPQDRLMLWFDFNNHDSSDVEKTMHRFMDEVRPQLES